MKTKTALPLTLLLPCLLLPAAARAQVRGARGALAGEKPGSALDLSAAKAAVARIKELQRGHTSRADEAEILKLLGQAKDKELDYIVGQLDIHQLSDDVDDHLLGPKNRQKLFDLLTHQRLSALSVPSRANIVDGLQRGHTDEQEEQAIGAILLGTHGAALTKLKDAIDLGGDHRDLEQLIDHDIGDPALRAKLVNHFQAEGKPAGAAGIRVFSDIDDTLYDNLKDHRYPKKTLYPGVVAFQKELGTSGHTVFLTARPNSPDGIIEDLTHHTLQKMGVPEATILSGSFDAIIGNQRIAAKKRENFDRYRKLFPEYTNVFVGDSGQGDAIFAQNAAPGSLALGLIHLVTDVDAQTRATWRKHNVEPFDTYVGAALIVHQRKMIDTQAMARVAQAAVRDFRKISFDSPAQKEHMKKLLSRDVAAVNALLPAAHQVPLP